MRLAIWVICFAAIAVVQSHAEENESDQLIGRNRDDEKDTLYDQNKRTQRREAYLHLQQQQQMQECCPEFQGYGTRPSENNNEPWSSPEPYPYTFPQ